MELRKGKEKRVKVEEHFPEQELAGEPSWRTGSSSRAPSGSQLPKGKFAVEAAVELEGYGKEEDVKNQQCYG